MNNSIDFDNISFNVHFFYNNHINNNNDNININNDNTNINNDNNQYNIYDKYDDIFTPLIKKIMKKKIS